MKQHILLVTDSYPPEIRSASHLMLELAEELTQRGYQVTVVTCWPQYNLDTEKSDTFKEVMKENGIRVIRVKHLAHHQVHFIVRGIAQLILPYLLIWKIKKYVEDPVDSVIVYSPPLPLVFTGKWVKKKWKSKFILSVQDVFPKNAIDLGVLKNKWLIKFFQWIEKVGYRAADIVTVHSEGNQTYLREMFPNISPKFKTLHNWVDMTPFNYRHAMKLILDDRLDNKCVAVFAGVIGPSQHLDFLVDVAHQLKTSHPDWLFLIVGDGTEKSRLEKHVLVENLNNVIFKPFVSRDDYPRLLAQCDIGLISLSALNKTPVVPGKLLGYMAASLPVLAFLNKESDAHGIISKAQCGHSVVTGDMQGAINAIDKFHGANGELRAMGQSGYQYAKNHFTKEKCMDQLEVLLAPQAK